MAYAENRNKTIGKALFERMTAEELITGKESTHWVKDLKPVLESINKRAKITFTAKLKRIKKYDEPIITDDIFMFGQHVRVILDKPKDTFGKKLHGTFRATDIRFSTDIYEIDNIILNDGLPPLYIVKNIKTDEIKPVAYTKNQLQAVNTTPIEPPKEVIRNDNIKVFIIKDIDDKRIFKKLVQYHVLYKGHKVYQWVNKKDHLFRLKHYLALIIFYSILFAPL